MVRRDALIDLLSRNLEGVLAVTAPIPTIDALPGDEIIVRPGDPDFPIVLRRALPYTSLAALTAENVKTLYAERTPGARVSRRRAAPRGARPPTSLRLVG